MWESYAGRRRAGFTLVELLVVIAVLAVLAAIILPMFMDSGSRGKEAARSSNLRLLTNAVALFKNDTDLYPATLDDLAETTAPAQGNDGTAERYLNAANWHGPYLQEIPRDPVTGRAYTYDQRTGTVGISTAGGADEHGGGAGGGGSGAGGNGGGPGHP